MWYPKLFTYFVRFLFISIYNLYSPLKQGNAFRAHTEQTIVIIIIIYLMIAIFCSAESEINSYKNSEPYFALNFDKFQPGTYILKYNQVTRYIYPITLLPIVQTRLKVYMTNSMEQSSFFSWLN
jgi:hypothetical protein